MRYVIYGAGAIGCTIGGRLGLAGHDVVLIARGRHLEVLRNRGLVLKTPDGQHELRVAAVGSPAEVGFKPGDVVFLTMKTQDTEAALHDLEAAAGPKMPVVCAQNGVENERLAARRFERVYGMLVALPATFLEPGEVIASAAPLSGVLHAGCYPGGTDATIEAVCEALSGARFASEPDAEPMRLKYRKLLLNLGNGLELVTNERAWGAGGPIGEFSGRMRAEGQACYAAAGITATTSAEYRERVLQHYSAVEIEGQPRTSSSTMQGLLRGNVTNEVDYLNGEIVLLGALHGVPTPANGLIRRLAAEIAHGRRRPGDVGVTGLEAMLSDAVADSTAMRP